MKKKLTALLAALSLLTALTAPAVAVEKGDWRKRELEFEKEYVAQQIKTRPEEYAAFDADNRYYKEYPMAKEAYMALDNIDEEQFRSEMWAIELGPEIRRAYAEYVTAAYEAAFPGDLESVGVPWALMVLNGGRTVEERAMEMEEYYQGDVRWAWLDLATYYIECRQSVAENHEMTLEYREQYPGSYEGYDPDKGYEGYWAHQKQITIDLYGLQDEVEWKEYMYIRYMEDGEYTWEQEQAAKRAEYPLRWPDEYAAFDQRAWYAGYYHDMGTPESYMEREGLDEEGFKQAMFLEWADKAPTGFFNGYCVTVDGTPIKFQFYRDLDGEVVGPKVENERILIPLRAAAEALGLTVEWKAETNQVVCSNETTTVTFTLNSTQYSGGTLDAAPFAENGVTYLPLRALGETLGCGVTWYPDFATAALTTVK